MKIVEKNQELCLFIYKKPNKNKVEAETEDN